MSCHQRVALRASALQVESMFFRVTFLFQSLKTKRGALKPPAAAADTALLQELLKWLQLLSSFQSRCYHQPGA